MIYSLSEIDAQAKKAVRGAGFGWGHAEEAGKAVRYLAAQQLPGAQLLSQYLQVREAAYQPDWQCPLLAGAALGDRGLAAVPAQGLVIKQLAYPLLLLPALMLLSRQSGQALQLSWPGVVLVCQGSLLQLNVAEVSALSVPRVAEAKVASVPVPVPAEGGRAPLNTGQDIAGPVWAVLEQFAQQTYVPATEASRRGAGPAE